jgi:hypothetical protein
MTLILPRRRFLTGLASLIAAPAIVRAEALMPIKVWTPPRELWRIPPSEWTESDWRLAQDLGICVD